MSKERSDISKTHLGKIGERLASTYLLDKGYQIVTSNYRVGKAEIDLITKKEDLLVFVEVKYRTSTFYGFPEDAVNKLKRSHILTAANHYLMEKNWQGNIRFDIVAIVHSNGESMIEHFEDCF